MRMLLTFLLFSYVIANAEGVTLPVLPTAPQVAAPPKTDDVLPIAPTRYDDHADAPATVFSSVNKDDPWEKFERGENLKEGGIKTENIAKKANMKDKNKRDIASVKNKLSKKSVDKRSLAKKTTSKKGKVTHASTAKSAKKRTPSSKLPSKKPTHKPDQQ